MSLRNIDYKPDYNKTNCNIAEEFYLPSMNNSIMYDRISGYFGSTVYLIAWSSLKRFVENNGKIRVICSPCISDEDGKAIEEGYITREQDIINQSIEREINDLFSSPVLEKPARVLACLVAEGILDVKIAVPSKNQAPNIKRLFHDKVGIFTDSNGDSVGFRGSMNETFQGLSDDGNIESIDVFTSWEDEKDRFRVQNAQSYFDKLWDNNLDGTNVYSFPEASRRDLINKSNGYNWEELTREIQVTVSLKDKWRPDKSNYSKSPRKHQIEALEGWVKNNRRGIFEHATGSGKTFTAICAIRDALNRGKGVVVLVPSTELLYQWKKEIQDSIQDIDIKYLLCGDGNNMWKNDNNLLLWTSPSSELNRIVLATMDTAAGNQFLKGISNGENILLVVDEVHRIGSPNRRKILNIIEAEERLGLSATPRRYGDPVGTAAIFDYFSGIIPPPFTLEDAIKSNVLTRYYYYPIKLFLTSEEQDRWNSLTKEINKLIAINSNGGKDIDKIINSNARLQMKLIERARIIKQASGKTKLVLDTISKHYSSGQRWIVYCDNKGQLKEVLDLLLSEGYDAYEYHSEMKGDRTETLNYFSSNGGILVSIRCLDEGVDIPETTHALIIASSKNPREFIQRRGRILRKYPGKHFANLYDAVVIPYQNHDEEDKTDSIIESELARAIQFGEWAENPSCVTDLKIIASSFGIDYKNIMDGGSEDERL